MSTTTNTQSARRTAPSVTTTRAEVLRLAADLECDPRTAEKLLQFGPEVARNHVLRERARALYAKRGGRF